MEATETRTPESTTTLSMTEKAMEMAQATLHREGADGKWLRVGVAGGGCSGFQYTMAIESEPRADDTLIDAGGVRLVVDTASLPYLQGVTIDYVTGLHGAGFKFLNPNASRTCGCGSSFGT